MIVRTTDKIGIIIKKAISYLFDFITIFGTLALIIFTMIVPNLFTLILSIILFIWGEQRGNATTILCRFLIIIMFLRYMYT